MEILSQHAVQSRTSQPSSSPIGYVVAFPTRARRHHLRKNLSMPLGSGESFRFFVGFGVIFLDTEIIERGFPSLAKS